MASITTPMSRITTSLVNAWQSCVVVRLGERTSMKSNLAPWLTVADGPRALDFYTAAFSAVERYRLEDDAQRVIVAQLVIDGADFWLSEDAAAQPAADGGPIRMILTVDDPESVFSQALAAGATQIAPVAEGYGWRIGRLADPFGHHWEVGKPLSQVHS
jgi:PhnB protein